MHDLSISEALSDPLIRQMLRADKISLDTFAQLLDKAARERKRRLAPIDWSAGKIEAGFFRQGPPPAA
ncbi:hypothetical protein [Rhizobium sp. CECT 9324]|jgi:hypothetical protein|uniref:hypothetical protein n=1 Tax=Rhizobium sp. CECT 9324 TaxID=2845820 RepID=UPI001E4481D5|nr:hypothetical protein [Rhizobium sp. CECT 9324]CAH0342545.1 hypothetical protein RHI9324_04269 [Rhizobium sp. CECT 9324]